MTTLQTPEDVLEDVDPAHKADAEMLLEAYDEWQYGVAPTSAAAAAVYAATVLRDKRIGQPDVAAKFDVSRMTIREYYQDIIEANGGPRDAAAKLEGES